MNVFELFAKLSLDTSSYDDSLEGAESKASSFGEKLKKGVTVAAGLTTAAIGATTAATVAGAKAFVNGISNVAQYADQIDKMSQKMNLSAEAYQEWDFVMQHAGTSIESMQASIKTLSNAAETGNEAFEKLGITEEQIAEMSGEELFGATITALQNVEDETERTYLAGQLLGRGATELGALLNMTAEETADMKEQVHDLGGVLSDEAVKSGAQFQDSLQNMETAFTGMKNSMLTNFLPSFSTVMDGLALVFSGDSKSGLGLIQEGVKNLADKITEIAPVFIKVGGTILTALAGSIAENAPLLIESGAEAVGTLVGGLIDNADKIFTAAEKIITVLADKLIDPEKARKFTQVAINLIVKLANAITEALPVLLPAIVEVINAIVLTLTQPDNLSLLINCALSLILALADGIVSALPQLISVVPEIIVNLISALIENAPAVLETVLYLIGALGAALLESLASLMGTSLEEVMSGFSYLGELVTAWISNAKEWLSNAKDNILSGVTTFFSNIGTFFTNGFSNIKTKVNDGLNNVKEKFVSVFENVKTVVKNAIEFLKGLFNFEWELPKIKLPHFSIEGKFSIDPPSMPKIGVEWYAKAMNEPYMLSDATIFGMSGGKLLGGGETGNEIVYGRDQLMADIAAVVDARLQNLEFVVPVYIGGKKIDQQVISANARNAVRSGGR